MLRSAPILLLDEPTSALDGETEVKIQDALDTLLDDRTVIVISSDHFPYGLDSDGSLNYLS
ncbi:MAG TPA: hypothetical protein PK071_06215, partial [Atopobiaceae bacterium]|nr:hypothetical protein [Atopobiaceae bacterium]